MLMAKDGEVSVTYTYLKAFLEFKPILAVNDISTC
jgi:hypothetical protein